MEGETLARKMTIGALGAVALIGVACGEKQAPPPPPPEVKVATVLQRDVPIYVEAIGQTRGSTEIDVRARVDGLHPDHRLQGGQPRPQGAAPVRDRPAPLRGRPRQGEGPARRGRGPARPGHAGRGSVRAARGQERDLAAGIRDGAPGPAGGGGRGRGREGVGGAGRDRPRLHAGRGPRRWPRGQDRGLPGDARGTRAEHASHPHLTDPDDPRPRRGPRAGVPPLRAQGPGA